jgi:hypothetical protein
MSDNRLFERAALRQTFDPELSKLQKEVLRLMGVDKTAFEAAV